MEFIFELVGAILEGLLEWFLEEEKIPKWIRFSVLALLIGSILALIIFAFVKAGELGLRIFLGILAAGFLAIFLYAIWKVLRFGNFQPAKKEELPEILKLYRSVIGKPGCTWSISYPNEVTLHEDYRSGNLYVLRRGKQLVGAGSIVACNELDDLDCWQHTADAREIARIVIRPELQSKGYGKHLVNKLCQRLVRMDCRAVHILVAKENHHALSLYREAGFRCKGECHRFDHDFYAYERKL